MSVKTEGLKAGSQRKSTKVWLVSLTLFNLAEEVLGRSVKHLKHDRTLAKIAFTKDGNYTSREAKHMVESELREEFKRLVLETRKVFETNVK